MNTADYVLSKAKASTNASEADAWLIMANTLAPQSFAVQMAAYEVHCKNGNVAGAADALSQMYISSMREDAFWRIVRDLVGVLLSQKDPAEDDDVTSFKTRVFHQLTPAVKQQFVLEAAERESDKELQCDLLMILLNRFRDSVDTFGLQLLKVLQQLELAAPTDASNEYTHLIVCDVLPALFNASDLRLPEPMTLKLLEKALRFYFQFVATFFDWSTFTAEFPRKVRSEIVEKALENPMQSLSLLVRSVADWFSWDVARFPTCFNVEAMRSTLETLEKAGRKVKADAVFYSAVVMLNLVSFQHGLTYGLFASRKSLEGSHAVALLPDISISPSTNTDAPESKKAKLSPDEAPSSVVDSFDIAARCLRLLNPPLTAKVSSRDRICVLFANAEKDERLFDALPVWLRRFLLDYYVWSGEFERVIDLIGEKEGGGVEGSERLQLIGAQMATGKISSAVSNVIQLLTSETTDVWKQAKNGRTSPLGVAPIINRFSTSDGRRLVFLPVGDQLSYVLDVLLECLERPFAEKLSIAVRSRAIGQVFVLTQFDWPKYSVRMERTVERLLEEMTKATFVFPGLVDGVCAVQHLEELAYVNVEAPRMEIGLDILPLSPRKAGLATRQTLRVHEEIQAVLVAKMSAMSSTVENRSELVNETIRNFLVREADAIVAFVALLDA